MRIEDEADVLVKRATSWAVAAGFTYRAFLVPASIADGWSFVGHHAAYLLPPAVLLTVANAALAVLIVKGKRPTFLQSRPYMYLDIALAVAVNLATPMLVPTASILTTGADIFWYYLLGTVFIWTMLRGLLFGSAIVAVGVLVEALMIIVNHADLGSTGIVQYVGRIGWLAAGAIVPWVILASATRGARIAVAGAAIASHEAERARVFGDLHDNVFQAFGEIARRAADDRYPAQALMDIQSFANEQADELMLEFTQEERAATLESSIKAIQADFLQRGLLVHLANGWNGAEPIDRVRVAMTGAAREALNNVLAHSGSSTATISLAEYPHAVRIVVRDNGIGYDPDSVTYGIGIPQSIIRRLERVGGCAVVVSAPGTGTTVELTAPVVAEDRSDLPELLRSLDSFDAEALKEESLGWFAIPALVYRACLTPLQVAVAYATLHTSLSVPLWLAIGFVWMYDLTLLSSAITGRFRAAFKSIWLFYFDISLAIAINVFAETEVPRGTALLPGHEFLWSYIWGTLVLWTAVRGVRMGLLLLAVNTALQALVVVLTSIAWSSAASEFFGEILKAVAALMLSVLITSLARKGFRLALDGGAAAGAEHTRAEELRSLCDEAVISLRNIVSLCADEAVPVRQRTFQARGIALQSVSQLRRRLAVLTGAASDEAAAPSQILETIDEFRRLGLRIEVVQTGSDSEPPGEVAGFLRTSLHAALDNAFRHSGARHVVVRMELGSNDGEIVIRDHGVGFQLNGHHHGLSRRESLGAGLAGTGTVETWSEPGSGTRVRIAVQW
jgi:signal transduction histidine kinase